MEELCPRFVRSMVSGAAADERSLPILTFAGRRPSSTCITATPRAAMSAGTRQRPALTPPAAAWVHGLVRLSLRQFSDAAETDVSP
jgi:hypothetical protein